MNSKQCVGRQKLRRLIKKFVFCSSLIAHSRGFLVSVSLFSMSSVLHKVPEDIQMLFRPLFSHSRKKRPKMIRKLRFNHTHNTQQHSNLRLIVYRLPTLNRFNLNGRLKESICIKRGKEKKTFVRQIFPLQNGNTFDLIGISSWFDWILIVT